MLYQGCVLSIVLYFFLNLILCSCVLVYTLIETFTFSYINTQQNKTVLIFSEVVISSSDRLTVKYIERKISNE